MRRTRSENSRAIDLLCRLEVGPQHAGPSEVDVRRAVGLVGVVVDEHADDAPERAGDRHLAGAQQRHAVEAQAAGGDGREVGVEVVGEGEDAADDVVGPDLVAGHDLAHELLRSVEDGGRLVDVDGGGTAQGEEAHRGAIMPVMRRAAVALLVCLAGSGGGDKLGSAPPSAPRQPTLPSPDFPANGAIPARFSCDGDKARPALRFAGRPAGAPELALVVVDPDAGWFVHWTAYAMAPSTRALGATGLPAGAREGENSTGSTGWTPPCPPNGTHRYEFHVYWLKGKSGLDAGAQSDDVIAAVRKRAGGGGLLVGRYRRH